MDINYFSLIGLAAGTCTTISFLPQVIKTFKTKETKDLSLSMYIVLVTGMLLWTIYGILIKDFPVILANSISLLLATTVLILKVKYG
jgi:MtN3 and saliva related transmembrane protein